MEPMLAFAMPAISRVDVPSKPFRPKKFNAAWMRASRVWSAPLGSRPASGAGVEMVIFMI